MAANSALRCPSCRKLVTKEDEYFPFCSDRCRLIDLGKWASGEYRISSPILDPEVLEGLNEESRRPRNSDDDD
ncbi:MAG TPA: DNA gyrase inhibitor YacG [Silvibacterium sp.]|nr:DNA gyrase inhibitor YacG [Silvibacterium sp.]